MSITAVPISIRLVLAPTAASSGNGEASWLGEVVHPEVGPVGARPPRPPPPARWTAAARRRRTGPASAPTGTSARRTGSQCSSRSLQHHRRGDAFPTVRSAASRPTGRGVDPAYVGCRRCERPPRLRCRSRRLCQQSARVGLEIQADQLVVHVVREAEPLAVEVGLVHVDPAGRDPLLAGARAPAEVLPPDHDALTGHRVLSRRQKLTLFRATSASVVPGRRSE